MVRWGLRLAFPLQKSPATGSASALEVRCNSDGKEEEEEEEVVYRMYKRRWVGVLAIFILNIVAGMSLVWFGPIADDTVNEFGYTLDEVNWLGNCVNFTYLPCAAVVPWLYSKLGLRRTCYIGALLLLMSAWIRYAGTADGLSSGGSYALILIGQILSGVVQPIFQVLIPGYSEKWFDLRQRTTATMLMSIANPIGVAIGQLISPLVGSPKAGLLIFAIIYSASTPFVLLVSDTPPTPPTRAAAQRNPSFMSLVRAMVGREPASKPTYMSVRQRVDFVLMAFVFGVLVAAISAFSILSAQDLEPYGYSDDLSGLMGATLLLVGIVVTAVAAPLFDRVFTHHLALTIKVLCPVLGGAWLASIWAVRAGDTGGLFALMAIIGATSLTMLPVAVELAVEITHNPDGSSAILWASANLLSIIFVLAEGALRAGPDADPPNNMHGAIIFQGVFVLAAAAIILLLQGKQTRRAADEQAQQRGLAHEVEAPRSPRPHSEESLGAVDEKGKGDLDRPRSPVTVRAVSVDSGGSDSDTTIQEVGASGNLLYA
ncbi:major facilitator superfamily domain-containing protein [Rhodofomes roseus]|uniref:Major facilitator superfamily domain-containing protein n=1 Tax=Rhodofomes roseus TaxID=34475 RepID=A0ABQ8KII1_9APHY|nr:major facilitator superfamily domain-containing protein [Rhodofomes roseus]KAH9837800.1 major facilitator superfamily domain-containing protein [Rhodofomes roseus]